MTALLPWDAEPKDVIVRCWRKYAPGIVTALNESRGRVWWDPEVQAPLSQPGSVQVATAELGCKAIQFDAVMHHDGRPAVVGDYRGVQVVLR